MTREITRRHRPIPGPKGIPVLGNMLQMDMRRVQHDVTNWTRTFGKLFQISLLGRKVVVISDAKLLQKAFAGKALSFHLNDRSENITKHVYYNRKHIGLANLSKETISLRNILKHKVLHSLMGLEQFERKYRRVLNNHLDKFVKLSLKQNVNPDAMIRDLLADVNSLVVSIPRLLQNRGVDLNELQ